jgi:HK97 family phage portal protein
MSLLSFLDPVREFLGIRSIDFDLPPLEDQLAAIRSQSNFRPWRAASIREALGVPAIYRAVSLISNTTGALTLEAYRRGRRLDDEDRPRLIVRPDPFTTPRDFYRDTAWNMATRGEAWWWVAMRDADRVPLSLINVPPSEVRVEENTRDLRYPIIHWRNRRMRNEDMRQITLNREPGEYRGIGPLQVCGAAVSVAVEAQEWAANLFASGGVPPVVLKAMTSLSDEEAAALKAAWIANPVNMPQVIDDGIEDVKTLAVNTESAQMLDSRDHQNGDAARMFGIPASLLDHTAPGSNLTYQNLETEWAKFVRGGLWPNYLEPIEQAMSDLLTRSTVSRFNVDALLRADIKTRYEVYKLGTEAGVIVPEEARQIEGFDPGDIENAPVPMSRPEAIPASFPSRSAPVEVRCDGMRTFRRSGVTSLRTCNAVLTRAGDGPLTCRKCKKVYDAA